MTSSTGITVFSVVLATALVVAGTQVAKAADISGWFGFAAGFVVWGLVQAKLVAPLLEQAESAAREQRSADQTNKPRFRRKD